MPFKIEVESSYGLDYTERRLKKNQLSPLAGMALSVDTSDKIPVNGVDLLNRHELSPYQDKELQRFINENNHILSWKEREKLEQPQRCLSTGSNYSSLSRDLNRGVSPHQGYRSLERKHSNEPVYTEIGKSNVKFIPPNINGHNYTTDFPGMEQLSDNSFLLQFGGRIPQNATNRPASAQGNYAQSGYGDSSRYSSLARGADSSTYGGAQNYATQNYDTSTYGSDRHGTYGAATDPYAYSTYSSLGRGGLARPSSAAGTPYGTLKSRKGVSWLDQERARSLSPTHNKPQQPLMSQYGSAGNLNLREHTGSPAYSNYGKHADNYNRFETQRHREATAGRQKSPFDDSRFGGFGDRPGSGVELTGHQWSGGEVITDPNSVPKGLRTRKLFYSPIGDGTVAADGYELKRRPVDLSPRVTITQLQHVDRGEKGRDGVNIYEKSWTNTMGSAPSEGYAGSDYGPGSGRNSRAGALSPSAGQGGPGSGLGSGAGGPGAGGPSNGFGKDPNAGRGAGDPFGSGNLGPHSGLGGDPFGSNGNLEPRDGRTSATPSIPFSDRSSYRFDTKTGYLITNPRELIHQYATTTPVATMELNDNTPSTTTVTKQSMYRRTEETTEERFSPYAPYKSHNPVPPPNKFVRQLRDDTMTHSQREANTHQDPMNMRDPQSQQRIHQIQTKTSYSRSGHDDIDNLTQQLVSGLKTTTPVPNRYA